MPVLGQTYVQRTQLGIYWQRGPPTVCLSLKQQGSFQALQWIRRYTLEHIPLVKFTNFCTSLCFLLSTYIGFILFPLSIFLRWHSDYLFKTTTFKFLKFSFYVLDSISISNTNFIVVKEHALCISVLLMCWGLFCGYGLYKSTFCGTWKSCVLCSG